MRLCRGRRLRRHYRGSTVTEMLGVSAGKTDIASKEHLDDPWVEYRLKRMLRRRGGTG